MQYNMFIHKVLSKRIARYSLIIREIVIYGQENAQIVSTK